MLAFPSHLVSEQFTLMDAVRVSAQKATSGLPSGLWCPDLQNPGPELISSPNPSSTVFLKELYNFFCS
jgi:hypothetical protein